LTPEIVALASFGAWVYLFTARGGFWRISAPAKPSPVGIAKSVCVIVPARNEEPVVEEAVRSLRPWPVI
jgi:cellulose synthase/poly-beta-1,6-N-acetylglucosamine synthase-like glycosyltransferase